MNVKVISKTEAIALASKEESHFFDRKAMPLSGKKAQKIVVAFANADGGEVIIGVADDKDQPDPELRWVGTEKIEDLNSVLQSIFEIKPTVDLRYEFLQISGDNKYVLKINIEKSQEVHKTTDDTVYQRYGAQSLPIKDPQKITELSFAKGATSYEDYILRDIGPEVVVDSPVAGHFIDGIVPKSDTLSFIVNQNLIDSRTWEPKVAAVLLFSENPSNIIPRKCAAKIVRYETREDDPERDHLSRQTTIEGPIFQIIRDSVDEVQRIMSSIQIRTPRGLETVKYPPEAIWEVVVNAFIHRDYSISDDVQIAIFDNRIEVISPGRFPGYVNTNNILDARYSRNPKIVRNLNRYPDPPNKDLGEGLNTTFQKMKEWGLKEPIITEEGNYIKVTLPHTPLAAPAESIMEFLLSNPQITNRQARELTGIRSENAVKTEFYKLRDDGLIEMIPELKGAKAAWRLTAKGKK